MNLLLFKLQVQILLNLLAEFLQSETKHSDKFE